MTYELECVACGQVVAVLVLPLPAEAFAEDALKPMVERLTAGHECPGDSQ